MEIPATKICPLCPPEVGPQPIDNFGICRARKDSRNLYCKACIRYKVTEQRQTVREYKSLRKRRRLGESGPKPAELVASFRDAQLPLKGSEGWLKHPKVSLTDRVLEAIRQGAKTQGEISKMVISRWTNRTDDRIGEALITLLIHLRLIRTEIHDSERCYFLVDQSQKPELTIAKSDVISSFSCLKGLMPGRKPAGQPEKLKGWIAA